MAHKKNCFFSTKYKVRITKKQTKDSALPLVEILTDKGLKSQRHIAINPE
jgi:hypothetical protein